MSMTIDDRAGSIDLLEPLRALGVPAVSGKLAAGDVEFVGNGPAGPALVIAEYKKLGDLFQCMRDGRFADQLRKMKEAGEYSWLLIEGRLRGFGKGCTLHTQQKSGTWRRQDGGISYQEMVGWSLTMAAVGGVHVWRTETLEESAEWVRGLYHWWTAKEWSQHRAHLDFYTAPLVGNPFVPPGVVQKVAAMLPGIGPAKSYKVAQHFKTVLDMVQADAAEWQLIPGVGKKGAETLVKTLRGA